MAARKVAHLSGWVFGAEPEHNWCYYYQKANLARQQGDWQEVTRLGDEAQEKGLFPGERTEWMPFIEGYVFSGRTSDAKFVISELIKYRDFLVYLCTELRGNTAAYPAAEYETLETLICRGQ